MAEQAFANEHIRTNRHAARAPKEETIGTVISTYGTMLAAFKGNEAFQARMGASGEESHIRTKRPDWKKPVTKKNRPLPKRTTRTLWPSPICASRARKWRSTPPCGNHFSGRNLSGTQIPVRDYLGADLPGLGDFPVSRIAELTPAAGSARP